MRRQTMQISWGTSSRHLLQDKLRTQSPETHQLQQTLQNNANEQVHLCSFPNDSGDGVSAFSTVSADDALTRSPTVETVLETGSDDGQDNVDLGRNV